jgi:hypothetical protein
MQGMVSTDFAVACDCLHIESPVAYVKARMAEQCGLGSWTVQSDALTSI